MYYAYLRCSTQTQMENNGFQMQEDVIAKYCEEKGIQLDGTFMDGGISGTKVDRDGLMELLATIKKGDYVIVQNTSRLWREEFVTAFTKRELRKIGAIIIDIEHPGYDLYSVDPTEVFMNSIIQAMDVYDKMQISMKLAKGRVAKAGSGNKACGTAPFGYKWQDAKIVIDYNNNMVVVDLFNKYLELGSLSKLLKYATTTGYKTSNGNDFSKQALANILHNDFYIGIVTHAGKKVQGEHEPIISTSTFESVQKMLNR